MITHSDGKDLQILSRLRSNARESLTIMSKKTGIPISTIYDKLKQQEAIKRYTALLDFSQLGYNTHALISLKVDREKKELLKNHLMLHPSVNSCYKINCGFDFLIECFFRNLKEMDRFLDKLEKEYCTEEARIQYLIDELKKEEFLVCE